MLKVYPKKDSRGHNRKEKILKQYDSKKGYKRVELYFEGKRKEFKVHQLVAMAFLNHIPCGYGLVVDHIDNNKKNNNIDNLQLITQRENSSKDRKGNCKSVGVYYHKRDKLYYSQIQINKINYHLGCYKTEEEASVAYQNKLQTLNK